MPRGETALFESPEYENGAIPEFLNSEAANGQKKLLGVKRPSNLCLPEVPSLIARHFPNAKLFAILRDPLARTKSAYYHYVSDGFLPAYELNKGMQLLLDGKLDADWPRAREILLFSLYAPALSKYLSFFSREKLFIRTHDQLVGDKRNVVRAAYEFLGVDADFDSPEMESRPQRVEYNLGILKWQRLRNPFLYEYNQDRTRFRPKERQTVWDQLALRSWRLADKIVRKTVRSSTSQDVDFTGETRKRLSELFIEDIRSAEALSHLNLDSWKAGLVRG